ncbi:hypothetical protein FE257_009497 [Aspergillus nanangensis]|uniref:GPI anchored cell wall protein n=1 Tax=Aspergillus nanangensis TaxID=2582783 RepID=A0AAD4CLL6_ASPNN|nr:hypothetical protein FE257_009497 [Aspergillus nanangensis]
MLFSKSALVFSFMALGNIAVAASTPACLISAVGSTLANPSDLKTACVKDSDKLQEKIADACGGDDLQDALDYYQQTCKDAGHKVEINSSAISSSSPTGTSTSNKSTSSGFSTATADSTKPTSSGSSQTGSGSASAASPSETVSAGSSDRHVSAAAFAAVVFVGFAATL